MRKKLLLITEDFPFGESERSFLETEFNELKQNFCVSVLANNISGQIIHSFPQEIPTLRFAYKRADPSSLLTQIRHSEVRAELKNLCSAIGTGQKASCALRILAYSVHAEQLYDRILKIVKDEKIDIIYTYWCTQATVAAVRIKKELPNLKLVTRFHGFDLYNERAKNNWQPLRFFVARNADLLVFACNKGKEYFLSQWPGEWEERCIVSYLGTKPMQRVSFKQSEKLVLVSCSNLIPLKRVEMIIEALALLPDTMTVEWHHLGDGPEQGRLKILAQKKLGGKPKCSWKFWGAVPYDEIEQVYQEISPNLFITTSSTEGLPVSVQEAFSMGLPAVGTDVGGMAELIKEGENGFLLPQNTTSAQVCDTLLRYARLPAEQRREYGQKSRQMWEKQYDAVLNAQQFVKLLQNIDEDTLP